MPVQEADSDATISVFQGKQPDFKIDGISIYLANEMRAVKAVVIHQVTQQVCFNDKIQDRKMIPARGPYCVTTTTTTTTAKAIITAKTTPAK